MNIPGDSLQARPRRWSAWLILLFPAIGAAAGVLTRQRMAEIPINCTLDAGGGFGLWFLDTVALLVMPSVGLVTGVFAVLTNQLLRTSALPQLGRTVPVLITGVGTVLLVAISVHLLNEITGYCDFYDQGGQMG